MGLVRILLPRPRLLWGAEARYSGVSKIRGFNLDPEYARSS